MTRPNYSGALYNWPKDGKRQPGPEKKFTQALHTIRITDEQQRFLEKVRRETKITYAEAVRLGLDTLMQSDVWKEYTCICVNGCDGPDECCPVHGRHIDDRPVKHEFVGGSGENFNVCIVCDKHELDCEGIEE